MERHRSGVDLHALEEHGQLDLHRIIHYWPGNQ